MTIVHGKCALSCIYDCFKRIYSICIILLCIIYLNYSKWDFAIQLCLHKTMRKFRVQLYLLILAFSSQLEKVVKLEIFFEFLQNSWAVICTCARQTEQPSNLITMVYTPPWVSEKWSIMIISLLDNYLPLISGRI